MAHKADLINVVARETGSSKKDAGASVDAFLSAVSKFLKSGDPVTLIGFGTFTPVQRAARTGRNPQTGEEIQIKATKTVRFKVGKNLKDSLNG